MNLKQIADEVREILENKRKDLCITFEEEEHTYTMKDVDGVIRSDFPSVSKVMKLFYDEFPTEEVAKYKSKGDHYLRNGKRWVKYPQIWVVGFTTS